MKLSCVTRGETEMPNIRGQIYQSGQKMHYMNSTAESRNKQRNRNVDEEDQEKKRSPLKSPRLCEEIYSPNNLHSIQIEIKRHYHPQKYYDLAQAQPMENETYFQTFPQDEFDDSNKHIPRPPSGRSSVKKARKRRLVTPQSLDKYEEYREKAEFGIEDLLNKITNLQKYKTDAEHTTSTLMNALEEKKTEIESLSKQLARAEEKVSIISQNIKDIQASKHLVAEEKLQSLQTENASLKSVLSKASDKKEHKLCNMKLSVKEKEINRLKGIIEKKSKPLEAKLIGYEGKQSKKIDDLQRQVNLYKDDFLSAKSNLKEEKEKTKLLIHQNQEKEDELTDMRIKYMRLQKGIEEYKKFHERSAEREKKIVEQQTEFERMCKNMGNFKQINDALSEKNDDMEDRIRKLQSKLDHLERVEETHHLCVEIRDEQSRYIKKLESEVEAQDQNFVLLQNEYDKLDCRYSTTKAENAKIKHLQSELDAKTEEVNKLTRQIIGLEEFKSKYYIVKSDNKKVWENCSDLKRKLEDKVNELENVNGKVDRAESLSREVKILQREKANVEQQNSDLTKALQAKGIEIEVLNKHRERIENLSKEYEKQRRTREKGEHEMTELEQVVQKKANEVEELNTRLEEFSKKCSALHRDKEEAHANISNLTDALNEKKRDIESLTNELERSETHVSVLKSRIDDMQRINTDAVNKSKSLFQNENASLKLAYEQATFKIKDLSKQLTNAKRDKENAESQIDSLSNILFHKKKELESVQNELARSKEDVLILSKDIKDIQSSKRLADEKLQGLQTENASLKSALSKATNEIDDFLNKGTNLHKYKTDAEHKASKLMKALREKDTENEALREQLARAEKKVSIISQDIKDIHASNRQVAEEKLQSLQTENASLKSALSKATNEIEDLVNKGSNLQKYKTDAEHKTSTLMNALREKDTENEALREQLARAEKNVSILSKDIKDMQASKRQVAEEKLQSLQTENTSLKSALSKATNEIEDLVNKDTNLQKYKTDAEHKTSTLMNALREKDTENEALREQLARAEKNVSILSKDIKDMQASKRQVAEEKLQSLQTENTSLKSALSKATNEIEDLLNKDTNQQKYKTDVEHKTRTLMNALQDRENEIEALSKQLARSEQSVSILSKDIKNIQESKRQVADEKLQDLQTENDSLKQTLAEATTKIDDLWNKCTNLQKYKSDTELEFRTLLNTVEERETEIETLHKHLARKNNELSKDKENAENQKNRLSKALDENKKEIETMQNDIARYKEKIWTLTKTVEDIKGSKNQAADENIKGLQKKIGSLESELRNATTEMNDLSYKYKCLQKDKESAEYTINKLSRNVQEKEEEISSLIEDLAKANENEDKEEHAASANSIQKLTDENASLRSELSQLSHETEKKVSALTKEIKSLQKSKGTSSEEYNARKLYEENEFLKAQLDRTSRSYEQLRKDYNEVKREKDHALNRLSSVAGEKLRNNNPGIADLSDENRPINLGEKFSQLYDDQWTDAIEHLEEMGFSETDGIRRLLDILKAVFDECVRLSDTHFNQLKELTGTSHLPSDQLKKLKDLRKATAVHSVAKIKQVVNEYMSKAFSKEKAACQTYIDRSIELCWLMSVQDPPVVIDFIAVHGQAIDDKVLRKFTKTGSKIDFLVWPVIRLHKNGPLLQKGVVQPI